MIIYRSFLNQIHFEFCFENPSKISEAIILCDGLPTAPRQKETLEFLASQGYLVIYPRYKGTWESGGIFLQEDPSKDIIEIAEFVKKGIFKELFNDLIFSFKINKIFIIGTSFGGSIALSTAGSPIVDTIVACSPVVSFKNFNKNNDEQDLKKIGEFIQKAFRNAYRMNIGGWGQLLSGEIIDPAKYLGKNRKVKKICIFQSEKDPTVNYKYVQDFANELNLSFNLLKGDTHFSLSSIKNILIDKIQPLIK